MAKRIFLVLMCLLLALAPISLVGCDDASEKLESFTSQIDNIEKVSNKEGIETYKITFSDGTSTEIKIENNSPEITISKAELDDAGNLILIMSDNSTQNLGCVLGEQGEKGSKGAKGDKGDKGNDGIGIDKIEIDEGELVVYYTNNTSKNLGPINEQKADNWDTLYYLWCITYPDYEYSQLEWMAQIVSNALEVEIYEITFDSKGGSAVSTQYIERGEKIAMPKKPKKAGYTFDGWYVGKERWSFVGYSVTENMTLEAKWIEGEEPVESVDTWEGEELNVLVTRYNNGTSYGVFSQMELSPSTFGSVVNSAYADRQALFLENFGVTVNWISASNSQFISSDLVTAEYTDGINYEIAIPRAHEIQGIVPNVYDMAGSEYIDFTESYYNQASVEAFTISGRTLFVGGDATFGDELVSFILYYNKDLLATINDEISIYEMVKNGTWTYDQFLNLAKSVHTDLADTTGTTGTQGDEDIYGFSTKDVSRFYHYAGIQEAYVDPDTKEYAIALNLDMNKVNVVISRILEVNAGTTWAHTNWSQSENAYNAFVQGRVLFQEQSVSELFSKDYTSLTFDMGIVPFPKYDSETPYYTISTNAQATFVCIPKSTKDREMSEFFVEMLFKTGNEYVIEPFKSSIKETMTSDVAEENVEMLEDYVFPNILCDVGYLTSGWSGFLSNVRTGSYSSGSNTFQQVFMEGRQDALVKINSWNDLWNQYWEE